MATKVWAATTKVVALCPTSKPGGCLLARDPLLCPKHGTTPNANPPSMEMEGLCPQPASEDGRDLGVARADPRPCCPVWLRSAMSPGFPDKLLLPMWHHKSWAGAAPWGAVRLCTACSGVVQGGLGGAGCYRTLCERTAKICSCNVPGGGKRPTVVDAGGISW